MAKTADKACCQQTLERWNKRIARYYTAFPVIKSVKCDSCTTVLDIRVYAKPGSDDDSTTTPE